MAGTYDSLSWEPVRPLRRGQANPEGPRREIRRRSVARIFGRVPEGSRLVLSRQQQQ